MPEPVESRILAAVTDVAATTSVTASAGGKQPVTAARVYGREVLSYSPERDGLPGVVVAWTPGRTVTFQQFLQWSQRTYPLTALLVAATNGSFAPDPGNAWRTGWAAAVIDALLEGGLADVGETHWVDFDSQATIDLSAFEAAGLYAVPASVLVTVRTPLG